MEAQVKPRKDAFAIASSADPDQSWPLGAAWSVSALYARAYLSKLLQITVLSFTGKFPIAVQ